MEKRKQNAVIAVLGLLLAGLFLLQLLLPDAALSYSERRALAERPELTVEGVFSGDYFSDLETYLLDQFPFRDSFRSLKALFQYYVLGMKDNNDIYMVDGSLSKLDYPLKESQAQLAIDKFNAILESHPQIGAAYYALIPDKNYFLAPEGGYPTLDYEKLLTMAGDIDASYIDLFALLDASDYYRTDSHWRQECIVPVAQALCQAMGTTTYGLDDYRTETYQGFRGVYAGQSALPVAGEDMTILLSDVTDSARVESLEHGSMPVYNWEDFSGVDPYDVYLSGAEALITLENPLCDNGRHLILFRDSFSSSIAPLLLPGYSTVTMVDLRYISSALLDEYVDFTDADVLFLYSAGIFNAGATLK